MHDEYHRTVSSPELGEESWLLCVAEALADLLHTSLPYITRAPRLFVNHDGEKKQIQDTYVWMEGGRHQEDVLVRVSCRMLSNGATIHVVLSNETPSPPLRIENRSSTQTLSYRLGGDAQENVRLLEPMRWNSLHWVTDDER